MAVDTTSESYDRARDAWKLIRDTAFGGGRQVKKEGTRYLPQLRGQSLSDYAAYVLRANFFNATKRTLSAFVGFIFTNNPEIDAGKEPSTNIADLLNDCTMSGKSFYDYIKRTVRDVVSVGRAGTLVEWNSPALANRPFLIYYCTEDILNWRYEMVGGRLMLTMIVLKERSDEGAKGDEFQSETIMRYRVVQLMRERSTPFVYVSLWEKDTKGEMQKIDEGFPERGTTPLTFIPFVFHNATGDEASPDDIPLDDLAQINISHYQNSADLEQGRHLCGSPTLVLMGFPVKGEYYLGATQAIVTEETNASAAFLQVDANSLSALSTGLDEKERQMAALGARMLEKQSSGKMAEAFETVQIRQSGEVSALTDIAIACSETLSKVLRLAVWWDDRSIEYPDDLADKEGENVHVELNTEFTTTTMDAPMLTAQTAAYQSGAISYEEYFNNLQKGGIIAPEKTIEEEREALQNSPVALPGGEGEPQAGKPGKEGAPANAGGGEGGGAAGAEA